MSFIETACLPHFWPTVRLRRQCAYTRFIDVVDVDIADAFGSLVDKVRTGNAETHTKSKRLSEAWPFQLI